MNAILANPQRRAVRRAARTRCHAVSDLGFELLGELALDLSPLGMMIACDAPAALGETVFVSLLTPGANPIWLDAEAEVTRILHGFRMGDPGYCAGLRFTYLERRSRAELLTRLAGLPPPIPRRRLKTARQRVLNQHSYESSKSDDVLRRPVVRVSSAISSVPLGVFRGH
jgi:PilZ domain